MFRHSVLLEKSPREKCTCAALRNYQKVYAADTIYIMWTGVGPTSPKTPWNPNHFVPLIRQTVSTRTLRSLTLTILLDQVSTSQLLPLAMPLMHFSKDFQALSTITGQEPLLIHRQTGSSRADFKTTGQQLQTLLTVTHRQTRFSRIYCFTDASSWRSVPTLVHMIFK